MAEEHPAKRRRFTSEVFQVEVGTEESDTFTIHVDTLEKHSPFFRAAVDKKWMEGQDFQIKLPEDEPDTFEAYLGWLHDGKIDVPDSPGEYDRSFTFLSRLYVFGEKVQNNHFCNAVMDEMTKTFDNPPFNSTRSPSVHAIEMLYKGTPKGSPARNLFVYHYVTYSRATDNVSRYYEEFVRDLLVAFMDKSPVPKAEPHFPKRETWYKPVEDSEA